MSPPFTRVLSQPVTHHDPIQLMISIAFQPQGRGSPGISNLPTRLRPQPPRPRSQLRVCCPSGYGPCYPISTVRCPVENRGDQSSTGVRHARPVCGDSPSGFPLPGAGRRHAALTHAGRPGGDFGTPIRSRLPRGIGRGDPLSVSTTQIAWFHTAAGIREPHGICHGRPHMQLDSDGGMGRVEHKGRNVERELPRLP
jgi:hypothetical protein